MRRNKRCRQGFTLVEIMVVIGIIGLLAAIAIPNFIKVRKTAFHARFIADLHAAVAAFEMRALEKGDYPPETGPGQMPDGMEAYFKRMDWTAPTPIGGNWDWDNGQFGFKAGISVTQADLDDAEMTEIDQKIDDGNLATGTFRRRAGGYIYILQP